MSRVAGTGCLGLAILLITIVSFAQNDEKLNRNWVAKDIEAVRLISQIIPIENKSIKIIKTILGRNTGVDERDLGFGAKRVSLSKGNGYTSFDVDVFTFNGRTGYYEIRVSGNLKYNPRLREQIIRIWKQSGGPEFSESDYGLASRKKIDSVIQSYQRAVGAALGELSQAEIPAELKGHYEYLISPLDNSTIGVGCCRALRRISSSDLSMG